jgi:fatty-acyl-CoA synthase
MVGVPIMWEQIAAQPGFVGADLSALTTAITGGSPVPERLLSTYQDKRVAIRQAYALTEVAGTCCLLPARDALTMRQSAGVPLTHTAVMVDADADGDVGEICVRGPQVMTAYWGRPQDTAEALADGWLRTGDLGRLDARGYLEVVDRKKDMIISGGLNVYPAEVEAAVGTFPGVAEVGAFGVPDDRWGETVAISVAGTGLDVDALLDHCRARLGDYKVPRHVELRTEPLPRSMSGKILRRELRASFAAR